MVALLKYLNQILRLSGLSLAMAVVCLPVFGAEDEEQLLTIEGDLFGKLDSRSNLDDPLTIIISYYDLLPAQQRSDLGTLHDQYLTLIPDYQVSLFAADSAEVTEVKENITHIWASIREIHEQLFKMEVVELLDQAYSKLLVVGAWETRP